MSAVPGSSPSSAPREGAGCPGARRDVPRRALPAPWLQRASLRGGPLGTLPASILPVLPTLPGTADLAAPPAWGTAKITEAWGPEKTMYESAGRLRRCPRRLPRIQLPGRQGDMLRQTALTDGELCSSAASL